MSEEDLRAAGDSSEKEVAAEDRDWIVNPCHNCRDMGKRVVVWQGAVIGL